MTTSSKSVMPTTNTAPRSSGRRRALLAASVLWPLSAPVAFGQDHARTADQPAAAASGGAAVQRITPGTNPADATKVLLDQANYWRSQYQPVKAIDALNRVLQIDPHNADALAALAQVQADRGDMSAAQNALGRLKASSPGDPRIPTIYQTLRVGPIDPSQLKEARNLAEQGRPGDAVQQYKEIFKGNGPTPGLATEYYSVLSGTDNGWDAAKGGLANQIKANPQDLHAQLSYAQLLTYREKTRAEGIARLNQLAANPTSAAGANAALRQALLWLPANSSSIPQLQSYLARHPSDEEIQQHLEAARHPAGNTPADEAGRQRVEGYSDLNHGRLDRAASQFQSALKVNPNDGDALGGLGLVRMRQGKTAEARRLLDRAAAAEPGKKRQWMAALGGGNGAVGHEWDMVRKLDADGRYAEAEAKLKPLLGPNQSNTGGLLLLAQIQQHAGQFQDAENTYRTVLGRQPTDSAAVIGLAGILSREGRGQEADQLYARAQAMGAKGVGQLRAQQLRTQAEEVSDPIAQAGLYLAAIAADPSNPWVRLELARVLLRDHRPGEAHAVMQGVGMDRHASADAVQAGILFANESGDASTAMALIGRVPARERTPDMMRAVTEAQAKSEIAQATQYYYINRPMARERLLSIAATPDRSGVFGTEVAKAFLAVGDKRGVREAVSTAMAANRGSTPEARVAYSGILLQAGQTQAAAALANAAAVTPGLRPDQAQALSSIESGIAVRRSDQLNQAGKTADAYDQLAPALERSPTNPDLNMALGRLYASNDQPQKALEINEALLQQDPNNISVRKAAVEAAIQAGETDKAERLVHDALQLWPNDPEVWVMSGQLAKADGDSGRALHDYQTALQLRQQQIHGASDEQGYTPVVGQNASEPRAVPNILTTPRGNGQTPAQYPYGAPMPLDAPRRGRSSENTDNDRDRRADNDADEQSGTAIRLAEQSLPHVQLAQARFPYYVSPAPELDQSHSQPDAGYADSSSSATGAAPYQAYGGYAPPYQAPAYQAPTYQAPAYPQAPAYAPPYAAPAYQQQPAYAPDYAQAPAHHTYHGKRYQESLAPAQQTYQPPAYPAQQPYQTPYAAPAPMGAFSGGIGGVPDANPMDNGGYENPFRSQASTVSPANPDVGILGASAAPSAPRRPTDAMSQEIDTNIEQLREEMAPSVQAGVGLRYRTGTSGLDRLTEETLPMEATYSPGVGQLKLQVAPTFLQGGNDSGSINDRARFGTLAMYSLSGATPASGDQTANGVGVDVTYGWKWVSVDLGATPFGFQEQNVVGGIEFAPKLTNDLRLRIDGERRAVTNSVLSYAGTSDPRTGLQWGGVINTSIHAQLEYSHDGWDAYGGGGFGTLDGDNVQTNNEWQFAAGFSHPVYQGDNDELRLGLDLNYFGYQHNEDFFSYGYGGYFSPQSYFSAMVPITYREKDGNLDWSIGASLGFQTYKQDGAPVFQNAALQSQLQALANGTATSLGNPNLGIYYQGQNDTGFAGGLQAEATYRISKAWSIGGRAGAQHTGNFTEAGGMVFARYGFGLDQ